MSEILSLSVMPDDHKSLGSSHSDSILLLGCSSLLSDLQVVEGKSWLNGVVSVYTQCSGISPVMALRGLSGGGGGGATINRRIPQVLS